MSRPAAPDGASVERVAVLGGGNGSYAAAADLADRGFEVRLWRRSSERLARLRDTRALELIDDRGARAVRLQSVTAELGEAVRGAQLIVMPLPAFAQEEMAARLSPHLQDGQVLYIPPGSLGSLAMAQVLARDGCRASVTFVESATLPYLARKPDQQSVAITARAVRLPSGAFPARRAHSALHAVAEAYPALEPRADALDAALLNAGPVIHPPLILLNAGPIEALERFDIHAEGTQPAVRSVQDALDAERIAVRSALGYGPPHFPLRDHYHPGGERWLYGADAHARLVASDAWREPLDLHAHRYMREDICCGLALLASLADWARVHAPVTHGLLAIASAILQEDLITGGRTVARLLPDALDRTGLERSLAHGPARAAA